MIYTTGTALAKATGYKEARVRVMIKDGRVKTIKNQYGNIVGYIILEKFLKDIL